MVTDFNLSFLKNAWHKQLEAQDNCSRCARCTRHDLLSSLVVCTSVMQGAGTPA
jgi:hypothetical protein